MLDKTKTIQEAVKEWRVKDKPKTKKKKVKSIIYEFFERLLTRIYLTVAVISVIALALTKYYLFFYEFNPVYSIPEINITHKVIRTAKAENKQSEYTVEIGKQFMAYRLNNPCNLKYAKQPNSVKGERGFARFDTAVNGFKACIKQIEADRDRGDTLSRFINEFAPPAENDTGVYLATLANKLGVDKNKSLKDIDIFQLASRVAYFESQTIIK